MSLHDDPVGPVTPEPSEPPASRRRLLLATALGGVLLLVLLVVVVVAATRGDDAEPAAADATPTASTPTQAQSSAAAPSSASSPASSDAFPSAASSVAPTDGASPSARPKGRSTASSVPDDPRAVARAFFDAALSGDCATAEELVSRTYLDTQGECSLGGLPSAFADKVTIDVGKAKVSGASATLPVSIALSGTSQTGTLRLVRTDGRWLVDRFTP